MEQEAMKAIGSLMEFTFHLLARVEALEDVLLQREIVPKEELQKLFQDRQRNLRRHAEWLESPIHTREFARVLSEKLTTLTGGPG
jgi:hypothetical protein